MAGLYLMIGDSSPNRLDSVARYIRFADEAERRLELPSFAYVWLGHDTAARYSPAIDPATGVHAIAAGRICLSSAEWQRSERLPFQGGTANRIILDRYLTSGENSVVPYNGSAVVCIWDPRDETVHIWTDQFGFHPAFVAGRDLDRPTVFTTFPDAVTADPDVQLVADEVSMAEFLRAWRITPPHTYYEQVKHAGAATHWGIPLRGSASRSVYWRPFESGFFGSLEEAADSLAASLAASVSERTAAADRVGLFVSGGADSRVMLFGADDPRRILGVNLYESEPTHESKISKDLCDRVGAKYKGFARDSDYYPRGLEDNVRWSGAMWSSEDGHYLGVKHLMDAAEVDLVMTACTTDWIFKGYGLERTRRRLFGRNLPIMEFASTRVDGFLPNVPRDAPSEFCEAITQRMDEWFAGCPRTLNSDVDYLQTEDRRIRPACYTVSVSGQVMYRVYPYDTFLADARIAECYSKIPAAMKLNGDVWGLAVSRVCQGADDIVDANFGWTVGASKVAKLFSFARGWGGRRIRRVMGSGSRAPKDNRPPCYASWPDLGWYAENSPTIAELWEETPDVLRERLARLWGSDPWAVPLHDWAKSPLDFFRVLTLLQFLRSSGVQISSGCRSSDRLVDR